MIGSRPISSWFQFNAVKNTSGDGGGIDLAVFILLLLAAVVVLIWRWNRTRILLLWNWPIVFYFLFCLISTTWAYDPATSFKRWIKAIGDLAIVMVIATEPQPKEFLSRLASWTGFIFFPTSLLLIKYFPLIGRGYSPDGMQMNTGVTMNKNMLGVMLLVISLCTLWRIVTLRRTKGDPNRRRQLSAQYILFGFELVLFHMANSMTSLACFALGAGLMFAVNLSLVRRSPVFVHLLCFGVVGLGSVAFLLGAQGDVAHALGRDSTLSGRKDIWAAAIPAAPNAVIGAGFESFWDSPAAEKFQRRLLELGWWHPENLNEAHNGYIEIYLNLGWVGICLIATILMTGYQRAVMRLRLDGRTGGLFLAYIVVSAVYCITEAGFRMLNPMWFFLLLGAVGSSVPGYGFFGERAHKVQGAGRDTLKETFPAIPSGSKKAVYAPQKALSPFRYIQAK